MWFSKKRNLVDSRPTVASWPQVIDNMKELPYAYREEMEKWLQKGMPLQNVTYVPSLHRLWKRQGEYAVAWFEDQVMILREVSSTHAPKAVISYKDVVGVEYYQKLLNCCATVIYRQDGQVKRETFQFNKTKEPAFIPLLNIFLGNTPGYKINVFLEENPVCLDLLDQSYRMYNFSKMALRLDESVETYYWESERFLYPKKGMKEEKIREYLVQLQGKGMTLIDAYDYGVGVVYLPWKSIDDLESGPKGLEIKAGDKTYQIPIRSGNQDAIYHFVREAKQALSQVKKKTI